MVNNAKVAIETSVDAKLVMQAYLRAGGVTDFLVLVREVVEMDAIPGGNDDATEESERCYAAMHHLDEVLEALESA